MNTLVFQRDSYQLLANSLLRAAPLEAGAILVAGVGVTSSGTRLLVREVLEVDEYDTQAADRLVIPPRVVADAMRRARLEGLSLVFAHTHPFSDAPVFSPVDDAGEIELMTSVLRRLDGRPQGALVIGKSGFDARLRTVADRSSPVERLHETGATVRRHLSTRASSLPHFGPPFDPAVWDRSVRAFGKDGQAVLAGLRVGIVGLGGTGSLVAQQLAYLGVGSFVLLDPDVVETSNLNRVIGSAAKVGIPKVEVASHVIRGVRPDAKVEVIRGVAHRAADARPLLDTDLIFCCTDTHGSRAVLNQLSYQYLIPMIDLGVRIDAQAGNVERISGRVQLLAPGLGCLLCQELLDPEQVRRDLLSEEDRARDPYIVGGNEAQPAVISINGIVAAHAVTMMLGVFTGLPLPARYQIYLGERGVVRAAVATPRQDCIVCSFRGALARGDGWSMSWRLI